MASIVSVPRGSVDRWGSMNLWHWNLWNKSGTESKQYLLNLLPFRSKNLCFDPFWSILIHFEHGRRSLTTASTLGEAARSSDAIRMAAMLLWKHVETTSGGFWSILIHSAILPRDCARSPLLSPQLPVWVSLAKQPEKHGFSLSFLLLSEYWQTESDFPKHAETHEPF